jgi:hypothetical protein
MSGSVRFTWLRSNGWTRIGVIGAIAVLFAAPMLWALGAFGHDEESVRRALVFAAAGIWFFFIIGYGAGWAMRGFIVRQKEGDEEERRPAPPPAHQAPRPAGR